MAIQQCLTGLINIVELIETEDTALSAKQLQQHHSRHTAAIASRLAADLLIGNPCS
jgi:prephenate dehydratase